jgi:hypothetical protein
MIKKIFLDLDGVCNRLIMHALEFVGCPVSRYRDTDYPTPGSYDIVAAANKLLGSNLSKEQFWSLIPRQLWAETPPSDEFAYLLEESESIVGTNGIRFLTTPTSDPNSLAGKLEWIHRFAPAYLHRRYSITCMKEDCALSDCLLVDDSDSMVNEFRNANGKAILVPRPWNSLHNTETLPYLKAQFASFKPTAL